MTLRASLHITPMVMDIARLIDNATIVASLILIVIGGVPQLLNPINSDIFISTGMRRGHLFIAVATFHSESPIIVQLPVRFLLYLALSMSKHPTSH